MLWGRPAQLGQVRAGFAAAPAAGFRRAGSFAIVPHPRRPRFLVPLVSRQAARRSMSAYNALRAPATATARAAVGAAFASGLDRLAFPHRLHVDVREELGPGVLSELLLEHRLGEALQARVAPAIGLGAPAPNRKPVLQLFDPEGSSLGYAKVGSTPHAAALVRAEAAALGRLGGRVAPGVRVPQVRWAGEWLGLPVLVTTPLPPDASGRRPPDAATMVELVRTISRYDEAAPQRLGDSSYWHALRPRLDHVPAQFTARLEADLEVALRFGRWHGDWVPWNIARSGGEWWIWDWEHSAPSAPAGLDLLHLAFQQAFVLDGVPLASAARRCRDAGLELLSRLGVTGRAARTLLLLYLAELAVRYEQASQGGSGESRRFAGDVRAVLIAVVEPGFLNEH